MNKFLKWRLRKELLIIRKLERFGFSCRVLALLDLRVDENIKKKTKAVVWSRTTPPTITVSEMSSKYSIVGNYRMRPNYCVRY